MMKRIVPITLAVLLAVTTLAWAVAASNSATKHVHSLVPFDLEIPKGWQSVSGDRLGGVAEALVGSPSDSSRTDIPMGLIMQGKSWPSIPLMCVYTVTEPGWRVHTKAQARKFAASVVSSMKKKAANGAANPGGVSIKLLKDRYDASTHTIFMTLETSEPGLPPMLRLMCTKLTTKGSVGIIYISLSEGSVGRIAPFDQVVRSIRVDPSIELRR